MQNSPSSPQRQDLDQSNMTVSSVLRRSNLVDPKKRTEAVLCISFNQDKSCIALGTNYGYKIFNAKNFKKIGERDLDMPIARIQMLYRSNLLLLVRGTPENIKMPGNVLIFWDDKANDETGRLPFTANINKVKMRKDLIFIVHDNLINVFSLESMQIIKTITTKINPYSIFTCSYSDNLKILAFPSSDRSSGFFTMFNLANDRPKIVEAHSHDIECLEMDYNGSLIASASKKGTIIRVFRVRDGSVLQELRRGIDNARISSLCFDISGQMLALSSDSGTVHVYMVQRDDADSDRQSTSTHSGNSELSNKKSPFSFLKKAFKYFDSEWSSLQLKVDEKMVFVNFNADSSEVLVYKTSGKFWKHDLGTKDDGKSKRKHELSDPVRLLKQA